jgi:hypothetical protein
MGAWLPQGLQAQQSRFAQAIKQLDAQDARLLEAYLAGVIALPVFQHHKAELERKRVSLRGQLRELEVLARQRLELQVVADGIEAFCASVRSGLTVANFAERRALVELLIDRVVVTGEVVEIRYAIPTARDGPRVPFCQLRKDYLNSPSASFPTPHRLPVRRSSRDHLPPRERPTGTFEFLAPKTAPSGLFALELRPEHRCAARPELHFSPLASQVRQTPTITQAAADARADHAMQPQPVNPIDERVTIKPAVCQDAHSEPNRATNAAAEPAIARRVVLD